MVEKLLRAGFYKKEAGMLGSQMAEKLYLDPERVSVTRLEKFASCAYAHFLSYGLRLSDREPTDLRRWIWEILHIRH